MIGFRLPNGQQIELAPGATMALEINNALLADPGNNGSYTLPVSAPRSPGNEIALQFAGLLDSPSGPTRQMEDVQAFDDDELLATGTLVLLKVTATTFELSLRTGISAVMAKLKGRKLRDFAFGGQRLVMAPGAVLPALADPYSVHMNQVVAHPELYDYIFAPASNNDFLAENPEGYPRRMNLNYWAPGAGGTAGTFLWSSGYLNSNPGVPGGFNIFPGYYPERQFSCVPFPYLGYVVRTMLQELHIPFEEDFFDAETETLAIIGCSPIDDPRANAGAATLDPAVDGITFRIGDVLPDITAHELLRKMADSFFLDLSTSPIGVLRIRRSTRLLAAPPAAVLTANATPTYTIDVPDEEPAGLATQYLTEHDIYAQTRYQTVEPAMRAADVATRTALPATPGFDHEIRLVLDEQAYYQHDGTEWQFYSVDLTTVTVGPAGDSATGVPQGTDLVLEEEVRTAYKLPLPGVAWPPDPAIPEPDYATVRVGVFGERGYSPTVNALARSQALRLGFYRGMQPFKDAAQGSYPLLTQLSTDLQGGALGNYSLRLDGATGTVAKWGQALLECRRIGDVVTWPVWLTAEQINQLDMGYKVEIAGIHFLVKKISVTFPIRTAAELQLVVIRPKAVLT